MVGTDRAHANKKLEGECRDRAGSQNEISSRQPSADSEIFDRSSPAAPGTCQRATEATPTRPHHLCKYARATGPTFSGASSVSSQTCTGYALQERHNSECWQHP